MGEKVTYFQGAILAGWGAVLDGTFRKKIGTKVEIAPSLRHPKAARKRSKKKKGI